MIQMQKYNNDKVKKTYPLNMFGYINNFMYLCTRFQQQPKHIHFQ